MAAISVVQAVAKDSGSVSTVTSLQLTGLTTTTGNLYAMAVSTTSSGATITGVTDSAGNTWVSRVADTAQVPTYIWSTNASSPTNITSVTATASGPAWIRFEFYEIANCLSNSTPIDVSNHGNNASSSSISSGSSGTPTNNGCLALGILSFSVQFGSPTESAVTFTSGAGTNHQVTSGGTFATSTQDSNTLVLTSATAQTYSATLSASTNWAACVALIKGTAPATGSSGNNLMLMGVG